MVKRKLKNRLIASYCIFTLLIVLALAFVFNEETDLAFERYAKGQRTEQIEQIVHQLDQQYRQDQGTYNMEGLEIIGNAALQNGLFIHVQTIDNSLDWDIEFHKSRERQEALDHADYNMHSRYPTFQGGYAEESHLLTSGGKTVGNLIVGYYGPYSLTDSELLLMNTLNRVILILGGSFLLLSILVGTFMARRITKPIIGVIGVAKRIASGEYGVHTAERTTTREVAEVVESVNEMSTALEREEQQKRQITADVAHELRTPLTNLQGHMEAMIDEIWEPTKERLESCHGEILRLNNIVTQLQELYSLESRQQELEKIEFDFMELAKELSVDFELRLKEKNICLRLLVPGPAPVYADYFRFKQCLVNLISNAYNYTGPEGQILLEYSLSEEWYTVKVHDSGTGIPQRELCHVFERFYRVDKSRYHKTGGMGIGLSITKAIIESHDGTIDVSSVSGEGTTFTIRLPRRTDE